GKYSTRCDKRFRPVAISVENGESIPCGEELVRHPGAHRSEPYQSNVHRRDFPISFSPLFCCPWLLVRCRYNRGNSGGGDFPRTDNHDPGKFPVPVQVAMQRHINNYTAFILRGVHKVEHTGSVAICEADMFCESFGSIAADTNHVAIVNPRLDRRNLALRNVIDCAARDPVFDQSHLRDKLRIVAEIT